MDINKVDSPESHKTKDMNIVKTHVSLEEKVNDIEKSKNEKYNELYTSIDEMQEQIKYLTVMNENMTLKLQISSQKEAELNDVVKALREEIKTKSGNEEILESLKNLKISNDDIFEKIDNVEKRVKAIETEKLLIKKDIVKIEKPQNNAYVSLSFNDKRSVNILERIFEEKEDPWQLHTSRDNDKKFKIFDIRWYKRNLPILINKCSIIEMNNIEELVIAEDVVFKNNMMFDSNPKTNLNFKNNSSIIIKANVIFSNINIIDCMYNDDKNLLIIEGASKLDFNNGLIKNNRIKGSLFYVKENSSLELTNTIFKNNAQLKEECYTLCIKTETKSNIYINKCEFLNHTSRDHPSSGGLLYVDGDLTINESKFKDNLTDIENYACIKCSNGNNMNMNGIIVENCSCVNLFKCKSVKIKKSNFIDNHSIGRNNIPILALSKCENINITECSFKNNKSGSYGGALTLGTCKGNNYIKNCLFQENHSKDSSHGGGAVWIYYSKEVILEDTTFYKNSTKGCGGAIYAQEASKISCANCIFESNFAEKAGGAICIRQGSNFTKSKSNRFISNTAPKDNDISSRE